MATNWHWIEVIYAKGYYGWYPLLQYNRADSWSSYLALGKGLHKITAKTCDQSNFEDDAS